MKKETDMRLFAITLLAVSLAFAPLSMAQDTKKEAPKVEVKAPVAAPVAPVAPAAAQPAPVAAQPAVGALDPTVAAPWWKVLLRYGLELVFTILGLLASVFVTVLLKKYGFESYTAKVDDILDRAVGYAEQKSLQALKLNGKPLDGTEKLALALDLAKSLATEYKIPEKGKEWWEAKVEGWLGVQKL